MEQKVSAHKVIAVVKAAEGINSRNVQFVEKKKKANEKK